MLCFPKSILEIHGAGEAWEKLKKALRLIESDVVYLAVSRPQNRPERRMFEAHDTADDESDAHNLKGHVMELLDAIAGDGAYTVPSEDEPTFEAISHADEDSGNGWEWGLFPGGKRVF